ncbi:DEAD/DEAH box helicase [Kordiimonas aquimaris]|uniref:DEAD/DEAH box helicase n=1 Tax=Kordiimonas aquimaris TaxID=707591 RepID=UPI0021D230E3|nr:DEAD/DEAH box helicase [Kordiimonas aquimaris]
MHNRRGGSLESNSLTQFNDLGLSEALLRALTGAGYSTPTPIQEKTIPVMLKGQDLIGIAQTGTGKTAAFVLPILQKIGQETINLSGKHCQALILAPTRELAAQIHDAIKTYGEHMYFTSTLITGGVKPAPQIRAMARGVNILVATPGRLEDHMQQGVINLAETRTVVLDEADQMLDMGFIPAIRRIMAKLPKKRQTVLLSATMPKQIRSLSHDFLKSPVEIAVAPASKPIERIEQKILFMPKSDKRDALIKVLNNEKFDRAIVFTRTKHGANKVTRFIEQAGHTAAAIHGNKSQGARTKALNGFKSGDIAVMVATDIAARGIDIDDVSLVINFELPNVPEVYVHRIGRTARAGKSGMAISFCDPEEREYLTDIEKLTGKALADRPALTDAEKVAVAAAAKKPAGGRGGRGGGGRGRGQGGQRQNEQTGPNANAAKQANRRRRRNKSAQADGANSNSSAGNPNASNNNSNQNKTKRKPQSNRPHGENADLAGLQRFVGANANARKRSA